MTAKETDFEHPPRGHVATLFYDIVNHRFQVVQGDDVDAAIPATAKAPLASSLGHGYDGTLWRKLPMTWGYSDRWSQRLDHTKVGDGDYEMSFTAVSEGYVHTLNAVISRNSSTQGQHEYLLWDGSYWYPIHPYGSPAANVFRISGYLSYVMKKDDFLKITFRSCTNGDVLTGLLWGYKMKIDM